MKNKCLVSHDGLDAPAMGTFSLYLSMQCQSWGGHYLWTAILKAASPGAGGVSRNSSNAEHWGGQSLCAGLSVVVAVAWCFHS